MCWYARLPKPRIPRYGMHQMLWTYQPDEHRRAGAARPFVYRLDRDFVHMLSRHRPSCDCISLNDRIEIGAVMQFALRCSPVHGTCKIDGIRHRGRKPLASNDERRAWLGRRLDGAAEVLFSTVFDRPPLDLSAPGNRHIRWPECDIAGTLRVTDRSEFLARLPTGVGGRGAWGHGLLYLPEVMG